MKYKYNRVEINKYYKINGNNIQQLYKTQQQNNQCKIPNDFNIDDNKEELSSVTPDICISGKIRCNKNKDNEIIHNDINHSGGNCDIFNAGAENVEHKYWYAQNIH